MYLNCWRYDKNEYLIHKKFSLGKYPYKLHSKPLVFLCRNNPIKPQGNYLSIRRMYAIVEHQNQ